jgi:hypothetical protein
MVIEIKAGSDAVVTARKRRIAAWVTASALHFRYTSAIYCWRASTWGTGDATVPSAHDKFSAPGVMVSQVQGQGKLTPPLTAGAPSYWCAGGKLITTGAPI